MSAAAACAWGLAFAARRLVLCVVTAGTAAMIASSSFCPSCLNRILYSEFAPCLTALLSCFLEPLCCALNVIALAPRLGLKFSNTSPRGTKGDEPYACSSVRRSCIG